MRCLSDIWNARSFINPRIADSNLAVESKMVSVVTLFTAIDIHAAFLLVDNFDMK